VPPEQALQILQQQSGKMFDPALVRTFIRMMGAFPPGTRVRLDTGEEAMALKANPEDPFRPIVRLVEGTSLEGERLRLVNLAERDPKTGGGYDDINLVDGKRWVRFGDLVYDE
jgi:hypothetical protein